MTPGDPRHNRHEGSRVWKIDVIPELQEAQNRLLLLSARESLEGARKPAARTGNGCARGAVVPIRSRREARPTAPEVESDKELFDQQAVVEKHDCRSRHALLVRELWIIEARQALVVPLAEYAS